MRTIWDGIEDPSDHPHRVWFSKGNKNADPWLPLSKTDCQALNKAMQNGKQDEVLLQFGRATADIKNNVVRYNFYDGPARKLGSAIWFQKESASESTLSKKDKYILVPITSRDDEALIDNLFCEGVVAQASKRNELDTVLKKEIILKDDDSYKVYIALSSGGTLRMRKRSTKMISLEGFTELQRGYGDYVVDGEKEELALGPVRHLSFIIHGIGEAMWSREEVGTSSLIDEVNTLRATVNRKMYLDWKQDCEKCQKSKVKPPLPPNRIEFIPIEWYGQIHCSSSTLKNDLISTTLTGVPKLRAIANDVIFDVLVYNTPEFCHEVLDCVTRKICNLYESFQVVHPTFIICGGRFSIVGHSLGSVIAWDLLSILSDNLNGGKDIHPQGKGTKDDPLIVGFELPTHNDSKYEAYLTQTESNLKKNQVGTWGPTLNKKMRETIPFIPSFTFFLGSPIGLFLTLRGARPMFNELLKADTSSTEDEDEFYKSSPFRLPSSSIYNIFSPNDPVAYRIEPLLLPSDFPNTNVPAPCFLAPGGKGVRLHVKAKELSDNIVKSVTGMLNFTLEKIPDMIGPSTSNDSKSSSKGKTKGQKWKFALGGNSDKVDYSLQPGVVENEYLAAIGAHNSYMKNSDLIEFWIECAHESNANEVIVCD